MESDCIYQQYIGNTFSLILPPMISIKQYHRPHYYIIEKIFLHPNFRQRAGENCCSSFLVSHKGRARAREKDDPRPCDRRRKTLFSQATINTLPNVRIRARIRRYHPRSARWPICETRVATYFLPCTRLLQHFTNYAVLGTGCAYARLKPEGHKIFGAPFNNGD